MRILTPRFEGENLNEPKCTRVFPVIGSIHMSILIDHCTWIAIVLIG